MNKKEQQEAEDRARELFVFERGWWGDAEIRLQIIEDRVRRAIANPNARLMRPLNWRSRPNGEDNRGAGQGTVQ